MADDEVEIWTDGACSGNPGPGGWAAILRYRDHEHEVYGGEPSTTNNRMELMGLISGLEALTRRALVRGVHRGDARVMRYRQELPQTLHLHPPELAALCVLLLRGPQTPGEIRTRAARMHEFSEPRHVEITLESLMTLATPLVAVLPRQRGQKEARYAHLLAGEPPIQADFRQLMSRVASEGLPAMS